MIALSLRLVLALVGMAVLTACEPTGDEAQGETGTPSPVAADEDLVRLTVYLRTGQGEEARLQPVEREVPTQGNLPLRAVSLLLEGPTDDEDYERPWPEGTEVRDVRVDGGAATVDLSGAALEGFGGQSEEDGGSILEVLALGALANTLTEFPTIEQVRLTIDGEPPERNDTVTAFWGGWGLPTVLSRDETLIREEGTGKVPTLADFGDRSQVVGSPDAEPVHVRSIRLRDRITYVRVVVELADAADHDASAPAFPRSYARSRPQELVLEVTGIDSVDAEATAADLSERLQTYVSSIEVGEGQRARSLRVTLTPAAEGARDIHLHTTDSPSRIVLDIRK